MHVESVAWVHLVCVGLVLFFSFSVACGAGCEQDRGAGKTLTWSPHKDSVEPPVEAQPSKRWPSALSCLQQACIWGAGTQSFSPPGPPVPRDPPASICNSGRTRKAAPAKPLAPPISPHQNPQDQVGLGLRTSLSLESEHSVCRRFHRASQEANTKCTDVCSGSNEL